MVTHYLKLKISLMVLMVGTILLICGCAGEPYYLSLNDSTIEPSNLNYQHNCNVVVNTIDDDRPIADHLGNIGSSTVYANDSLKWLEQSLSTLESNHQPQIQPIFINSSLKKLYVTSIHQNRIGNVVLLVNFKKGELDHSKLYRGSDTSINWFGTEIAGSFEEALQLVIDDIKKDLENLCRRNILSNHERTNHSSFSAYSATRKRALRF